MPAKSKAERVFEAMQDPATIREELRAARNDAARAWAKRNMAIDYNGSHYRVRRRICGIWVTIDNATSYSYAQDVVVRVSEKRCKTSYVRQDLR